MDLIGIELAHLDQVLDLGNRDLAGRRHVRIEVARRHPVDEVAGLVALPRLDQRHVGLQRSLQNVFLPVELRDRLALGNHRAESSLGVKRRNAGAARAQLFGKGPLRRELELEFTPQGTLAEKLRAGGAGIPAFYTKTGYGTVVAEGKPVAEFEGQKYILERSLKADVALVKAWKGDKSGNLIYRMTARNFNPNVATAGKVTIAEVEHLVETGELEPDQIHTPGIFVQRIVLNATPEKRIEQRTVRKS